MAIIDLKNAVIVLSDGTTPTANDLEIEVGEGSLEYSEKRNIEFVKRRGELETTREGDEEPMDVSFQFVWEQLTTSGTSDPPTLEDALKQRGGASDWLSVNTDSEAPYSLNIVVTYYPTCGEGDPQTIALRQFHHEELSHSFQDGTIDCKGKCNDTEALSL